MFKVNKKKHQNDVIGFEQVIVSCINMNRLRNTFV